MCIRDSQSLEKISKNFKNLESIVTDTRNKLIDDCNTDGDLEIVCPVVLCLVMMMLKIIQMLSL